MMLLTSLTLMTAPALAAREADLETTVSLPASTLVYDEERVSITVANNGNKNASDVELTIQLPETHTSPTVYVMGDVTDLNSKCSLSGTEVTCDLGRVRKNRSKTVWLDIILPWSAAAADFDAAATTTTAEANTADDSDIGAASLTYVDVVIAGPIDVVNQHCTGTDLIGFYECTLFPSSISSHDVIFNDDGTIDLGVTDYTGTWEQDTDDHLWFEYSYQGNVVAEFEGNGVNADCFEGITDFGTGYVAPYEVCLVP